MFPLCRALKSMLSQTTSVWEQVDTQGAGIKGREEEQAFEQFLSAIPHYDVTRTIAEKSGDWVRQFGRSHGVEIPDALIAATAATHNLELKTLNTKHYPMIKDLAQAYKKS